MTFRLPSPTFGYDEDWSRRLVGALEDKISEDDIVQQNLLNAKSNFGDLYVTGGATAQTGIGTSYVKVTGFGLDGLGEYTLLDSTTNNRITVKTTGHYIIGFSASFTGTALATYTWSVHVGQSEPTQKIICSTYIADANIYNVACSGILVLSTLDQVEMFIKADGASKSFTPQEMHLWLKLIG